MRLSVTAVALVTAVSSLAACNDAPSGAQNCPFSRLATNISAEIRDSVTGAPLAANSRALLFQDDISTPGGMPVDSLRILTSRADTTGEAFKYSAFAQPGHFHVRISHSGYVTWSAPVRLTSTGCAVTGASLEARLVHT